MVVHGLGSLIVGTLAIVAFANPVLGAGVQPWQIVAGWIVFLVVTPAHAIFEYFAVGREMRPVIPYIRSFCPDGEGSASRRVIVVDTRRKLLFLSIFITAVPLAALGLTLGVKTRNLLAGLGFAAPVRLMTPLLVWAALLVLFSVTATIAMEVLMARDVSELTSGIVQAMRRVESGTPTS